jgi:Protein of unknown function (DUF2934)
MAKQRTTRAEESLKTADQVPQDGLISTDIATLAYHLWEERGCPVGSPEIDWFDAEQQLRKRREASPAVPVNEPLLARSSGR